MNPSEDQLRNGLTSAPDDWSMRLQLVEKLADRWAGQEMDMLLAAAPNAPGTEAEMRKVVDLANAHCPGYRGLKHVLGLFLQTHLTSSWAHFIQAQAHFYSGDEEAALRHYQTSKSLNPSRSDEELEKCLAARSGGGAEAEAPRRSTAESDPITPVPPRTETADPITPVPPRTETADPITPVPPRAETAASPSVDEEVAGEPEPEPIRASDSESENEASAQNEWELSDEEDDGVDSSASGRDAKEKEADFESTGLESEAGGDSGREFADETKPETKDSERLRIKKSDSAGDDPDLPFHTELLARFGRMISAAKKEDDSREKLSALSIAVIIHVVAMLGFAFWHVVKPRPTPPMFVSSVLSDGEEKRPQRLKIKKYQRPQMPAATARMNVMTAPAISSITMPEMNQSVATFDPIGTGDEFGLGMSFGGGSGGAVSFFGSRSTSKKVIFVVDVSASMGGSKDELMRKELAKSIESLPPTVEYALIFFGGPAWYAGQKPGEAGLEGQWEANVVQDGSRRYVWYEGWSEKERHGGNRISALYHYSLGENNLPKGQYRRATKSNIRQTLEHIRETPLVFGTDWRWPLKMAMNMKPDNIFFMTDGAFGTGPGVSNEDMIRDLLEYNRKRGNSRINTVCMMVLQARKELEELARGSKGEFTLVLQNGTTVRGSDLDNR